MKLQWRLNCLTVSSPLLITQPILLAFFGTVDANEVAVPYVDPVTAITPQPPTKVQFQPLKGNLQGFCTYSEGW